MSFTMMGKCSPILDTGFEDNGYMGRWQGWSGPELKEPLRQQLQKDVDHYLACGGQIKKGKELFLNKKKRRHTNSTRARKILAKLTPEQVQEIKAILRCKTQVNHRAFCWLAQEYGTTAGNIRAIWLGESWTDVH
jgi:hypothetical protein